MFPAQLPGIGLLLLRFSIAGTIVTLGSHYEATAPIARWLVVGEIGLAVLLCIGYLTPPVASVCCLLEFLLLTGISHEYMLIFCALMIPETLALALVGPGAYSLDAQLFGRRLIRLPK